jgi:hypothetical protein
MHQILVSDLNIEVHRKNIKNLHLGVYPPEGRVRVAAPLNIDDEAVRLFVISKLPWIHQQQKKFVVQPRQSEREYVSGETHYFQGQPYLLHVIYQDGKPQVIIRNKTHIDLYVRKESPFSTRQRIMTEWYRQQLKILAEPMIEYWQKQIGVNIDSWGIRIMRTKWGTCNIEDKRINLNLELAKKPKQCLEYIIVHELLHLIVRHHNDHFIGLIEKYLPNWQLLRDELNALPLKHEHWEY